MEPTPWLWGLPTLTLWDLHLTSMGPATCQVAYTIRLRKAKLAANHASKRASKEVEAALCTDGHVTDVTGVANRTREDKHALQLTLGAIHDRSCGHARGHAPWLPPGGPWSPASEMGHLGSATSADGHYGKYSCYGGYDGYGGYSGHGGYDCYDGYDGYERYDDYDGDDRYDGRDGHDVHGTELLSPRAPLLPPTLPAAPAAAVAADGSSLGSSFRPQHARRRRTSSGLAAQLSPHTV